MLPEEGPEPELTTVGYDEVVIHHGTEVTHLHDLPADTDITLEGIVAHTLPRPAGELLARFATINDVHFGETVCGVMDGDESGAIRPRPGEPPYPETMNAGAVAEMAGAAPDVVLVKGDLTCNGLDEEYQRFREVYDDAFGDRLVVVRGNHESYHHRDWASDPLQVRHLPGVTLALADTCRDGHPNGTLSAEQIELIDDLAARADRPVLLFGHHHIWRPDRDDRSDRFFGLLPDASEALAAVVARRPSIRGYFAGHTHRNRRVRIPGCGHVPFVEVSSAKDFPGSWAEYHVFEGGIVQLHRRISTPGALDWTERTRAMFGGLYPAYAFGRLSDRCFVIP